MYTREELVKELFDIALSPVDGISDGDVLTFIDVKATIHYRGDKQTETEVVLFYNETKQCHTFLPRGEMLKYKNIGEIYVEVDGKYSYSKQYIVDFVFYDISMFEAPVFKLRKK